MKKEVADIVEAAKIAEAEGKKAVLATVVQVEGSSYRRAGARMLVTEDGTLTGAISGGCLEGDALRKALLALQEGKNKVVTYDTSDEEDAKFGVQLGCNGIVHILFEPINFQRAVNPVSLLRKILENRWKGVLVTAFDADNKSGFHPGTCGLFFNEGIYFRDDLKEEVLPQIHSLMFDVMKEEYSRTTDFLYRGHQYCCFLEFVSPPLSLVIAGAGNDVIPLVDMAAMLGWKTSVFDGRPAYANPQRFKNASLVKVAKPPEVLQSVSVDDFTVFILMSHNYNYDLEMLKLLLHVETPYVGVLGPKKKLQRMLGELEEQGGPLEPALLEKIFGPVGLDIGAESAEEIALAILSELKALFSGRRSSHLRDKSGPIHSAAAVFEKLR